MKRFTLLAASLVLGACLLAPVPGNAIPTEGCWCPGGGTTLWQTTWGGAPTYNCSSLAAIGYSGAQQYAASQCANGVCSLTFANEACIDSGCATQHYDLSFTYRCYLCIN